MTTQTPAQVTNFWTVAASDPDRAAIVSDDDSVLSYGQLASLADRVSNGLRNAGVERGDTVAALMSNRAEYIVLSLATLQIGVYLAPLNRHLTPTEIGYVLGDSGAKVLVVDDTTVDASREAVAAVGLTGDRIFAVGTFVGMRPWSDLLGDARSPDDRIAGGRLFYTSGTTGLPKGVRRPLSGQSPESDMVLFVQIQRLLGGREGGTYLSLGPLYHAAPHGGAITALQMGQTVILTSGFEAHRVAGLIQRHGVTEVFMVPTMMHRFLTLTQAERASYDLSSLRLVLHAAAMCPVATKQGMIDWLGPILMEYYGASEAGLVTMISSEEWLAHKGSVGRPRAGMHVEVRDPVTHELLPPGETGLLYMSKTFEFEYEGDHAKTEASHYNGYFTPGDMGRLDQDGYLYIADRRNDLIVSGGVNIYPAEIEAVLLGVADVLDAVVFGVPDPEWGHSVQALVVPRPGAPEGPAFVAELRHACERSLARFKIPRVIGLTDELPRNAAGKINRTVLRESYLAGDVTLI